MPTPAPTTRLILASASPRRADLMREQGYDVTIIPPPLMEPRCAEGGLSPARQAEAISYFKARAVADRLREGLVLGGDTIVSLGERILGKPRDLDHARAMLSALAGTTHEVITGVTLLDAATLDREMAHAVTRVTMRPLSPEEIESYLRTGAWEGKAGGYGIQDEADAFITTIEGSFSNVVGFPMELIADMLQRWENRSSAV